MVGETDGPGDDAPVPPPPPGAPPTPKLSAKSLYNNLKQRCEWNPEEECVRLTKFYSEYCEGIQKTPECEKELHEGFRMICEDNSKAPACDFLPTTTSTNKLPFIIGGVAGIIVLLAVGIGLFFYCRRKSKKNGHKKTMEGSGEGSVTNGSGVTPTASTPTAPTNPTGEGTQGRY